MSKTKRNILIIEDDESIVAALRVYLQELGQGVIHAENGMLGLERAAAEDIALIVLDLGLPDISGMEVCRELRRRRIHVPILMLTSRSDETDKFLGFETGADDYLTKPFGMLELIARVKALIRRSSGEFSVQAAEDPQIIAVGPFSLDKERRSVEVSERPIGLTALEFDLLWLLVKHPDRVFSKEELLDQVWGYSSAGYDSTVTTHMSRLRAKIETDPENPQFIKTVWGRGYKFVIPQ